jgi:F0F1-type ATP synthase membrane subunit b/b'
VFHFGLNDAVAIAKFIDFVIFVTVIALVYRKWGQPLLVAHQEAQNKQVEDAVARRAACADLVVKRQAELEQAKRDGVRMVEVALQQAERLVTSQRAAAEAHAVRTVAYARGELDRERYRARHDLLLDTVERAYQRAKEIARRELDATVQSRLLEGLMSALEAKARA